MGGGGSGNAFIDYAIRQAEEKRRKREAREATVPIEDKKRLQSASVKKRRQRKEGRNSTLLSKDDGDTLGVS